MSHELFSHEAEEEVLGALILKPHLMLDIQLAEEDFYHVKHKILFAAISQLIDTTGTADAVALNEKLKGMEYPNTPDPYKLIGGMEALIDLMGRVITTDFDNIKYHTGIIRDRRIRRNLLALFNNQQSSIIDTETKIDTIVSNVESELVRHSSLTRRDEPESIGDGLPDVIYHIKNPGELVGVPTGFYDYDLATGGLHKGDFIIFAARASMGKTSAVLNIAQNIAVEQDNGVLFFSLEMSSYQLRMRSLAIESGIPYSVLQRQGHMIDDIELGEAATRLWYAPLYICDTKGLTPEKLKLITLSQMRKKDIKLVVVDYLQLLRGSTKDGPEQEVAGISKSLKEMAWELNMPILACAQLNRKSIERTDKRPVLSDLRYSGALEQDADCVTLLHRDDYHNHNADNPGMSEWIIAKQRNGPVGTIYLEYQHGPMRFRNIMGGNDDYS